MLTLTRRAGESISIGDDVEVVVLGVSRGRARIGIKAPRQTPVHRTELLERIGEQNQRARRAADLPQDALDRNAISFPRGIIGLAAHKSFVLCDTGSAEAPSAIQVLVSRKDVSFQISVVEATAVVPDYPVEDARKSAHLDEEVAVALVVAEHSGHLTTNLIAPIVIGLDSRCGFQVVLDRRDFGVAHELLHLPGGVLRAAMKPTPAKTDPRPLNDNDRAKIISSR